MGDSTDDTIDVNIWNDGRTKAVTVTTDGSNERLDVSSKIVGGSFQLQEFDPVVTVDSTGVTLNTSTWTTLLSVTSTQGKLGFIACSGSLSTYRMRVTMDSVEIFDVAMSDLSAIGLSNATNVAMWAETADKNFRYHPKEAVDFSDSLLIEAKAVTATPTIKSLITHREVP